MKRRYLSLCTILTMSGLIATPLIVSCSNSGIHNNQDNNHNQDNSINAQLDNLIAYDQIHFNNNQYPNEWLDNLTNNNVLLFLNLPSNIINNNYQVIEFNKQQVDNYNYIISFRLTKGNYLSKLISVNCTITIPEQPKPPKPETEINYKFVASQSNSKENIISYNQATIFLNLNSNYEINDNIVVNVKLQNSNALYQATNINKLDSHNYQLEVNITNLNKQTSYNIEKVIISLNNKQYDANVSNNLSFKTLNNIDSVTNVSILNNEITTDNNSNQVDITLDQLLPTEYNKTIRLKFINNNQLFVTDQTIIKNKLSYSFSFNNLSLLGTYAFDGVYIVNGNNETILNNALTNKTPSFTLVDNNKHDSEKPLTEYGNFYGLQVANKYMDNDAGIKIYNNDSLNQNTLMNKNQYYQTYFSILSEPSSNNQSHDTITSNVVNNMILNSISTEQNKVIVQINNQQNINISNISFLVKSYDQHTNWSKWINGSSLGNNQYFFDFNSLNQNESKFIITNINIDNNIYEVGFNKNNLFSIPTNDLNNIDINNFDVYKDNANKHLYGSLMLKWSAEQARKLKDKTIVLTFKTTPQPQPRPDPFGGVSNPWEQYNPQYSFNEYKKIYVPFNQLHKFSLDNLTDGIEYTLSSFEIVNTNSFLPFINQKDVTNKKLTFHYNFDWNSNINVKDQLYKQSSIKDIAKEELDTTTQKNKKPAIVQFSPKNFNTVLDYNFDLYNYKTRYPNAKTKLLDPNITIVDNGIEQSINYFMPREVLANTVFKINDAKNQGYVVKDINSIQGLNNIDLNKVIIWFTLELDLNNKRSQEWTELSDIHSRIRVPVSLGLINKNSSINDVDFMFDSIEGNKVSQQKLYSKIKANIKFDISLSADNKLKLTLSTRNNDIKFNNKLWLHNTSESRSAYITNATMFVNWLEPKTNSNPIISYQEHNLIDSETIQSTAVGYNNTYDLKYRPGNNVNGYPMADNVLLPEVGKNNVGKRLYIDDQTKGINQARQRVYSLNKQVDGSWNIIGKVNNDPNDFRFYAMVNYHVWRTNKNLALNDSRFKDNYFIKTDSNGNEYIEVRKPHLVAPTATDRNQTHPQEPLYKQDTEIHPDVPVNGNLFEYNIPENEVGIRYGIFMQYLQNKNWGFDTFKDNNGFSVDANQINNRLDMIMAIVDFSPIFKAFDNKNLDTITYQNRSLDNKEKNAIRHFLNFKNLKTLSVSELSYYMHSLANLNFYIASIPKNYIAVNPDSASVGRYREYLIANPSTKLTYTNETKHEEKCKRPVFETENIYFDIYNGSSGTGVYDHLGNLVGLDCQGSPSKIANYIYLDTQKYSFFGNADTIYNPYNFYNVVNKMSFLYPYKFNNIFK